METYQQLAKRHQSEYNDLPIFYAFNNKQFEKGMQKMGLTINDLDKICSLGCGGYIEKTKSDIRHDCFSRQRKEFLSALKADETGEGFIFQAFDYELANHEYCVTGSTEDALRSLGIDFNTDIKGNHAMETGIKRAIKAQERYS